jgi:threonine/homoserine/homoserine lactone efflux protein
MAQADLPSLSAFAAVATITPGGATVLAASAGARFGWVRSLPLLLGLSLGLAALTGLAGAGLGAVVDAAPGLRLSMRSAGSLYVLWLAWRTARAGRPELSAGPHRAPPGFVAGVGLLWLNPKAWTMAMAASAAFADLAPDPVRLGGLLAVVFGFAAAASLSLWCGFGLLLSRRLRTDAQWRAANVVLGSALAASVVPIWL